MVVATPGVTWVDVRTQAAAPTPLGLLAGYAGAVLEVADAARARSFYVGLLGLSPNGDDSEGPRLRVGAGQHLVLAQRPTPRTLPEGGAHLALRFTPQAIEAAVVRLQEAGVAVSRYHEDRDAERDENRYCSDPDGNRLQLVAGRDPGIDHAAIETHDIEWAETFYTQVLGGRVEYRVGWHMQDYVIAHEWGAGRDECAPGTRRWDKRYTSVERQAKLPRPNAHIFVGFAPGLTLGIYLATEHRQEPPRDQFVGTPRIRLRAGSGRLEEVEARLRSIRLRCMKPSAQSGGPFERHGQKLFVRDTGGNFLEIV